MTSHALGALADSSEHMTGIPVGPGPVGIPQEETRELIALDGNAGIGMGRNGNLKPIPAH